MPEQALCSRVCVCQSTDYKQNVLGVLLYEMVMILLCGIVMKLSCILSSFHPLINKREYCGSRGNVCWTLIMMAWKRHSPQLSVFRYL